MTLKTGGDDVKVAVISDIHGFSIALDRVLADIHMEEGIERIIVAGDLCESGPDPRGVLARLDDVGAESLQGNTDRDLANDSRSSKLARFTIDEIGVAGVQFLAGLPFDIRLTPPQGISPSDDLLVFHANPFDQDLALQPEANDQQIASIVGDTEAAVLAFGHVHIAYMRWIGTRLLVDVSAVGNPKDGDLRCKWGLFTWNAMQRSWHAELRFVEYPLEETITQIMDSGVPNPKKMIDKLQRASY